MGLRRAVVWLGLAEHDDEIVPYEDDGGYAGEDDVSGRDLPTAAEDYQIATVRPQNFRHALLIGQHFRRDVPVIVNLDDLEIPDAKRIVDFMSGLVFGRRGDIERVSSRVFLIVPTHCSILKEAQTVSDKRFFNQA